MVGTISAASQWPLVSLASTARRPPSLGTRHVTRAVVPDVYYADASHCQTHLIANVATCQVASTSGRPFNMLPAPAVSDLAEASVFTERPSPVDEEPPFPVSPPVDGPTIANAIVEKGSAIVSEFRRDIDQTRINLQLADEEVIAAERAVEDAETFVKTAGERFAAAARHIQEDAENQRRMIADALSSTGFMSDQVEMEEAQERMDLAEEKLEEAERLLLEAENRQALAADEASAAAK